jgi:hypothetical protein
MLLQLTVSAQEQEKVQVQFVSFPRSVNPEPVELIIGKEKTITVDLPTNSISKVYSVERMGNWTLGTATTDAEGMPSFTVYGKVKSIVAKKQIILVIRKGINNSDGLELIPMANQTTGFGGGKCFIMNASTIDIAGKVGEKVFALKPRKHTIIKPKASREKNNRKYSNAYFYYKKNKKPEPFFSSVWRLSDNARNLVFIYHEPTAKRLRLHIIRDYL